ncbi:hypothetical protein PG989_004893 [Apiospora arundinis]
MAGVRFRLVLLTRATLVATSRLGGHQPLRLPRGSRTPPHRHSGLSLGLDRQPAPHVAQALVVDPQDPVLVPEIPDLGHEAPELVLEPQGAVHVRVGLVHGLVALLEDLADDGREGHGGVGALELGRRGHDFLKGHHQRHGDLLNTIESPLFLLQEIPLLLKLGLPVNGIEPARSRGGGLGEGEATQEAWEGGRRWGDVGEFGKESHRGLLVDGEVIFFDHAAIGTVITAIVTAFDIVLDSIEGRL